MILAEGDFRIGGRLLAEDEPVDGLPGPQWVGGVLNELIEAPNVRIMERTTVTGVYDQGTFGALERVSLHEADPGGNGFLIPGAPLDVPVQLRFDSQPGFGADFASITPAASPTGFNFVYPELPLIDHDFELWWHNYTTLNEHFVWGTPTSGPAAKPSPMAVVSKPMAKPRSSGRL